MVFLTMHKMQKKLEKAKKIDILLQIEAGSYPAEYETRTQRAVQKRSRRIKIALAF